MSYRDLFVSENKKMFARPILMKKARENVYELIDAYFTSIFEELSEEEDIAGKNLQFSKKDSFWTVTCEEATLIVTFGEKEIGININSPKYGINGYDEKLVFENGYYNSRTYDQPMTYDLLDTYLEEAFGYYIKY